MPQRTRDFLPRGLALLVVAAALAGCGGVSPVGSAGVVELEGWEYRLGDSPRDAAGAFEWLSPGSDGGAWRPIDVARLPPDRRDEKYLWLRTRVPAGLDDEPHVYLRYVDQAFDLFLDGERIYRHGDVDDPAKLTHGRRWHLVPLGANAAGRTLTLRVYSDAAIIGVSGRVLAGSHGALLLNVLRYTGLFVLALLFLSTAVASLAVARRQDPKTIAFSALSFAIAAWTLATPFSPVKQLFWDAPGFWWYLDVGGLYLMTASYAAFWGLVTDRHPKLFLSIGGLYALYALGSAAGAALGLFPLLDTLGPYYATVPVLMVLAVGSAALGAWRGSVDARFFLAGISLVALAGSRDTLVDKRVFVADHLLTPWAYLVLLVCLGMIIRRGYTGAQRSVRLANQELEEKNRSLLVARQEISGAAGAIERESRAILGHASAQLEIAGEHSAAVDGTSAIIEEIAHASREVTERAEAVIETGRRSVDLSVEGQAKLKQVGAGLEELAGRVQAIAGSITGLSQHTLRIGEIIALVKDLAEQSNLLALNARIEAAKAGEHGQGFAVVASEMRALAEQSKEATVKVRETLREIQKATRSAVEATEAGASAAQGALKVAGGAGEVITGLAEAIRDSASAAQQIAGATRQQTDGVELIVAAVGELTASMSRAVDGTRQIEQVAGELSNLSQRLGAIVADTDREKAPADGAAVTP